MRSRIIEDERRGVWSVRDSDGVIHLASVFRATNGEGELIQMSVTTGCHPRAQHWHRPIDDHAHYGGYKYPTFGLNARVVLVDWRVNEPATCVACACATMSL